MEREKRVIDVERADIDLVKAVIEEIVQRDGGNGKSTASV